MYAIQVSGLLDVVEKAVLNGRAFFYTFHVVKASILALEKSYCEKTIFLSENNNSTLLFDVVALRKLSIFTNQASLFVTS